MNPFVWIRKLYDRVLALSAHPKAMWWLGLISFIESSFFPIPPDVLLLPMCLSDRKKAMLSALVCTLASVLGGLLGYAIGALFFDSIGQGILAFYGIEGKFEKFQEWYALYGGVMVFVAGLTPIPYKVITISTGVFGFSIPQFVILSLLSRGIRFFAEALIVKFLGEPALVFVDKHFNKLTILGSILLVGGFVIFKYIMPH